MLYCRRCFKLWPDNYDATDCDCGLRIDECQATPEVHPVQLNRSYQKQGKIRAEVAMAAYEVYCHVYQPQAALVTGGCRGGFGAGELIALLYARRFPKSEWRQRVVEAMTGATID